MLVIRLYIALLTLAFLLLSLLGPGIHVLHGTVIICALLFQILDIRKEIDEIKLLETQIASLTN